MITHPDIRMPSVEDLSERIAGVTRSDAQYWADAEAVTRDLFGDATTANIFVVGMAHQAGCLPISAKHLEEAIALNGVAVERNVAAFRWGRAQVATPETIRAAREQVHEASREETAFPAVSARIAARIAALDAPSALRVALTRQASELVAWQNEATALVWIDVLDRVTTAERVVAPGSTRLLGVVAANLYKLMAYKDEYEVARLLTDSDGLAVARDVAGKHGRIAW
jgi:indolepyruvate ferredoxin oxidoreductase